jgi:hypothetical protein
MEKLIRPVLAAAGAGVLIALVQGCMANPRAQEQAFREESSYITRPSGVGDQSAVYPVTPAPPPPQP